MLFSNMVSHDNLTMTQEGWCDSVGSVEQIQSKLLKRQEAAAKRERAMAYALAHQVKYDDPVLGYKASGFSLNFNLLKTVSTVNWRSNEKPG